MERFYVHMIRLPTVCLWGSRCALVRRGNRVKMNGKLLFLLAQMEKNGALVQKADTVISSRQKACAKVGYAHNATVTDDVFSACHGSPQWNSTEIICLFESVAPPREGRETNDDVDPA